MALQGSFEVFYYQTERGESPIEDFLNSIPRKARAKCLAYMDMLEEFGFNLPRSFIAKISGDLWELRPEWAGMEYRFLYFALIGKRFVILHAFTKKRQRLNRGDIAVAEARIADIRKRLTHESTSPIRQRTN
jgi:phage-related protein